MPKLIAGPARSLIISSLMPRQALRNCVLPFARGVFDLLFPAEKVPFEAVEAGTLFPGLYDREIVLGKLDRKWGDLPSDQGLIFLCLLAKMGCSPIVEFGTFRGRTTYNLALNSEGQITTVDIGSEAAESIDVDHNIENRAYPSHTTGELFLSAPERVRNRIKQVIGDSTKLEFPDLYGKAGMVIVDGGHSYKVCRSDSEKALGLVRKGGVIVWDDYEGYWPGVKQALDELSAAIKLYFLPREHFVVHIAVDSHGIIKNEHG